MMVVLSNTEEHEKEGELEKLRQMVGFLCVSEDVQYTVLCG